MIDYEKLLQDLARHSEEYRSHLAKFDLMPRGPTIFDEAAAAIRQIKTDALEQAAKLLDDRAQYYQTKADRHPPLDDFCMNMHDSFVNCREAIEWRAAEIRNLKPLASPVLKKDDL